ncbi:hypothetical protein Emtol_0151 (plasmid) [Emticicia oligotrophica DSM 17448]|uniref:DUF5777 domain-containing protein n=1 Tax=Emticicia oligotrophica (strain DSM 17448 / CIP 109782 / MTCC 6937 / GPTSA100-15) TaxID=929562 RepID=A0ABM5N870_EMTOG|nr:DUF5777 family beta-barrel protein [Emticicia oligotrophica]AFK05666.1 hypothetical protein Emtol_0151 [Emticicia oligotrophica DSM 17448]
MKKELIAICIMMFCASAQAQDLLDELDKTVKPKKTYSSATFKSTRIINGHSVETISKNHLDFRISHRFGKLNDGAYNFFGLDQATMRIGLEYGLTDFLMVGIGRSTTQKTFDYFAKYKVLRQAKGGSPVSITAFGSVDAISLTTSPQFRFYNNLERLTYTGQLLIARKFGERLSLQLTPTFIHRNKVELDTEPNDIMAVGIGGRVKISKRTSFNAEYFYRLPMSLEPGIPTNPNYYNSLSMGFDIETGGHVFQLHFTNSLGMIERQFIGQTEGNWAKGDVHYGFNISRTFSFDKKKKI